MDTIGKAAYMCAICNEELASSVEFRQHLQQGCDSSLELIDIGPQISRQGLDKYAKIPEENNNNIPIPVNVEFTSCFQNDIIAEKQHFETDNNLFSALIEADDIYKANPTPLNTTEHAFAETRKKASEAKWSTDGNFDTDYTARGKLDVTNTGFDKLINESKGFRCQLCGEFFDEVILLKKHVIVGCSAKVKFRSDIKDTIVYTLKKTTCVNLLNDTALRKQNKSALSVSMFHVISPTVFKTKGLRCYYRCPVCEIYFNQADDLSCHFILVTLHNELGLSLEQPIQLTETSVDPMGETHKEMLIYHCSLEVEGELKCNVCLTYCRSLVDFVKHVASHLPWFKDVFVDYSSKSSEAAVDCLSPSTDSLCKTISNEDNSSVTKAERDTVQCCTEIKRILNEKTEKVASCDEVTQTDTKRHSKKVNLSIHHTFDKSEVCFGRNSNHNERFKTCSHILKHERRTEKSKNVCKGMLEETLASKDLNMNPQHSASVTSCINVGLTATQCPKLVPRNLIRRKKRRFTSRKRYHRCGHCNHMYSSVHSIKGHIHSHFQVQRYRSYMYECDHCNRVVSSIDSLEHHVKLHFKLIENAVGKLRCDHCNRFFSSARRLKYHIMSHFLKNICACVGCAET